MTGLQPVPGRPGAWWDPTGPGLTVFFGSWLVIQAPYEGLDPPSCHELDKALAFLHHQGAGLMIFVHNRCDIPDWCTHVGVIAQGRLGPTGARISMVKALEGVLNLESPDFKASVHEWIQDRKTAAPSGTGSGHALETDSELVVLNHGSAGYNGKPLFTGLNLKIHTRDHTLVTGPNGSGKSTLLQVITGDHPACYQNDLRIFGIQRGSGESIWDLKKHMGIVSSDLHRNYHLPGTTLHSILSGLFDSIGLYQRYTPQEGLSTLLYVSHRQDEFRPFFKFHLRL